RAIAHGMYTAARALATVGVARGDAFRWTVVFGKPVLLPGTVTFGLGARATGGHDYAGWDARSGKRYLTIAVTPLRPVAGRVPAPRGARRSIISAWPRGYTRWTVSRR